MMTRAVMCEVVAWGDDASTILSNFRFYVKRATNDLVKQFIVIFKRCGECKESLVQQRMLAAHNHN